jgi:hypothetical protein
MTSGMKGGGEGALPIHTEVRDGWDKAFKAMALQGDDALLDGDVILPTRWDEEDWEW